MYRCQIFKSPVSEDGVSEVETGDKVAFLKLRHDRCQVAVVDSTGSRAGALRYVTVLYVSRG